MAIDDKKAGDHDVCEVRRITDYLQTPDKAYVIKTEIAF